MTRPVHSAVGVTLLEVLLALALTSLVLATLFIFTQTTMQSDAAGRELAQRSQLARVVIDRIANDVRQAAAFGTSISGDKNSIRVLSTVLPDKQIFQKRKIQDSNQPIQYDLTEVHYYLKIFEDEYDELDDGTQVPAVAGVFRREWKILGHENRASLTQGMSSLPQAVMITVGYKPIELEPVEEQTEADVIEMNPGVEEYFAPEIKCLKIKYHDGKNWVYRWAYREGQQTTGDGTQDTQSAPQSTAQVRYDEEDEDEKIPHPDRYTVIVRLYQSDPTGMGSKITRIMDELQEQFGGTGGGNMEGLGALGALGALGGQGGGDLASKLKELAGQGGQLGDLQKLLGGQAGQLGDMSKLLGGQGGQGRNRAGAQDQAEQPGDSTAGIGDSSGGQPSDQGSGSDQQKPGKKRGPKNPRGRK
jgi:type II secretory pathway component PulJ